MMEWTQRHGISQSCLLLLVFLISLIIQTARARISCYCNTQECRDQGRNSCLAKYYCYVEFMKTGDDYRSHTRGCIDDRTPISCERFLPQPDAFLRTHCCDNNNFCNNITKMPKLPTRKKLPPPYDSRPLPTPRPRLISSPYEDDKPGLWRAPMNPMYIAAPIAAACIVVSMIIFVIYLIKRKESETQNDLVYADYDPAFFAGLRTNTDRDDNPVLNPVLYKPFLKLNKSPV